METLHRFFIFVIVFGVVVGNEEFVTKEEFKDLQQIVRILQKSNMVEKTKNDKLRRNYRILEGTLNNVLAELKSTKSTLSKLEHERELSVLYDQSEIKKGKGSQNVSLEMYGRKPTDAEPKDDLSILESNKSEVKSVTDVKHRNKKAIMQNQNDLMDRLFRRLNPVSSGPEKVAFNARDVLDYSNLGYHQTLVFKTVLINVGSCYHQTTGVFSPSISGVYVLYFSTIVAPNVNLNFALVKDGTDISYNYASGTSSKYSQAGNMAIVQLNAGDNVWVRIVTQHPATGYDIGNIENSFSGFLLF